MPHHIVEDSSATGHPRITCTECNRACVRQPYMTDIVWELAQIRFREEHREPRTVNPGFWTELRQKQLEQHTNIRRCGLAHELFDALEYMVNVFGGRGWVNIEPLVASAQTEHGEKAVKNAADLLKRYWKVADDIEAEHKKGPS